MTATPLQGFRRSRSRPASAVVAAALAALVCVSALVSASGCGSEPADALRGVVLVSVDTLRPDHLGAYGHPRPTSPALDQWASEGTLFEHAMSVSPWTLPAHASLLTGLYPRRHGVLTSRQRLAATTPTLAQRFRSMGFRTAGIVNSVYLGSRFGLGRGFEEFQNLPTPGRAPSQVVASGLAWLRTLPEDGAPFFLFLHLYDVHSDYHSLPEFERAFVGSYLGGVDGSTGQLQEVMRGERQLTPEDRGHLTDLYDAGIRQADAELGRLGEALEARGWLDRTIVAVTSDHGEEFLEHGGVLHARSHYDELLRIPLVLRGPGVPAGVRVERPVSIVDVMPTLLALAGAAPGDVEGLDLSVLWGASADGASLDRDLFAQGDHGGERPDRLRSVRSPRHKLIEDVASGRRELYDLESDPAEAHEISAVEPEVAAELAARLEAFHGGAVPAAADAALPLDPESAEQLRALGYAE